MSDEAVAKPELNIRPHPKKTDYGIGILACGWVVKTAHLLAYRRCGFNLVGVADLREEELAFARSQFGIQHSFTDFHDLLARPEVAIIDVCTQTFGRAELVEAGAVAGKHVLVQKPFARSIADGMRRVAACNRAGVKLGVNSHYRWLTSSAARGRSSARGPSAMSTT